MTGRPPRQTSKVTEPAREAGRDAEGLRGDDGRPRRDRDLGEAAHDCRPAGTVIEHDGEAVRVRGDARHRAGARRARSLAGARRETDARS